MKLPVGKLMRNYFAKARERSWKIYSKYYGNDKYRSPEARYIEEIGQRLTSDSVLLDAGCGADMVLTRPLAPKVRMAVGADIEELKPVGGGAYGVRADLGNLPFKDKAFDIIIQTPNAYDYVSLVARLTPLWFHQRLLSSLLDRKEEDTFRTFFKANSRRRISTLLAQSNLVPVKLLLFNQYPAYLMFFLPYCFAWEFGTSE
jgi:hypothetical protein